MVDKENDSVIWCFVSRLDDCKTCADLIVFTFRLVIAARIVLRNKVIAVVWNYL